MTGGCPSCEGAAISPHPKSPGFFQCDDCGAFLTRLKRRSRNDLFGSSYVYVAAHRTDLQVHGRPKPPGSPPGE